MATIHIQNSKETHNSPDDHHGKALYRFKGKTYEYARNSLYLFGPQNTFRWWIVRITVNKWFDRFILASILLNSITLAMIDYENINKDPSSPNVGMPVADGSWRNLLYQRTDVIFTYIFLVECVLKVIAMGFYFGEGKQYIKDPWNVLDFIVVVTSVLTVIDGVPDVSLIRCFRVLRPLKSISSLPGLQKLIKSMLKALPQLTSVLGLLSIVFAIFGILGLSLFSGKLHARCRLTPYPVDTNWTYGMDYTSHRCLNVSNFNFDNGEGWTKSTSPWRTPQDCYWPVDEEDVRSCSLEGGGLYTCVNENDNIDESDWRWCGSNYDALGNHRFKGEVTIQGRYYTKDQLMRDATFIEDLNWGYTNFDTMATAFITIFQSVTMEGWSIIMFITEDAAAWAVTRIFFLVLILFGAFLVLNLLLAVLEDNFTASKDTDTDQAQEISSRETSVANNGKFRFVINGGATCNVYEEHGLLYQFVTHRMFTNFVTLLIIMNTVILSMDVYPVNESLELWTETLNFTLSIMFAVEMALKIVALGIRDYCSDSFNLFDGFIVIISVVELFMTPPSFLDSSSDGGGGISAFRSFRLFRIFKLAREWRSMRSLLATLLITCVDISNFCLLLLLFMYVYALIGMQFFANKMRFDEYGYSIGIGEDGWSEAESPRPHFDNLWWSLTTVFVVLSGENWNTIMYDCRRASSTPEAVGYFMSLIVFGMFIVMNLFLAILLSNFTNDDPPSAASEDDEEENSGVWKDNQVAPEMATPRTGLRRSNTGVAMEAAIRKMIKDPELAKKTEDSDSIFPLDAGKSLMFLGPTHPVRYYCARIVNHPIFDNIVLLLIIISSFALAVSNPLNNPYSTLHQFLSVLDKVLTVLFCIEMFLKIVALGFCMQQRAYLRNWWNVLDFVVVLVSVIDWGVGDAAGGLQFLRALRALRAFRPLRVISRAPGLKKVVNTMFQALPDVFNVGSVCLIFFLIFSIVGVNYLKGNFRSCQGDLYDDVIANDDDMMNLLQFPKQRYWPELSDLEKSWFGPSSNFTLDFDGNCSATWPSAPCCSGWQSNLDSVNPTSKQLCQCWGAEWDTDLDQNFDNVLYALLTFFEISTTEAWVDVMISAVDSNGPEYQPIRDNRVWWVVFFILFIVVGSYLVMNLFVGVIIDNFQKQSQDEEFIMLTEQQQLFVKTQKIVSKLKPLRKQKPPNYPLGDFCFKIIDQWFFDTFIMTCIILNTGTMAMQHFGQSDSYALFLDIANYIFAAIFTMEAIIKLLALKMKYFRESWNRFDFTIVLATIIGLGLQYGSVASIIRTFRIGRVIRLINGFEFLNQLFQTLFSTIVGLSNVAALLFLMVFIFSVMGVQLFAKVALHDDLTYHMNFQSFGRTLMTLCAFATGENWNGFMHSVASDVNDDCVDDPVYDENMCGYSNEPGCIPLNGCGKRLEIIIFMVLFTLTINFILINLFVGVILEDFKGQAENDGMSAQDLKRFSEHWSLYDPDATYFMPYSLLDEFLRTLFSPWGVDAGIDKKELHTKIARWKITIYKGNLIHFYDVIHSVSKDVMEQRALDQGVEIVDQNLEDAIAKVLHTHNLQDHDHEVLPSGESINIEHHYAASVLQNSFRRLKKRSEERRHTSRSDSGQPLLGEEGIPEDISDINRPLGIGMSQAKDQFRTHLPARGGSIDSLPESKDVSTLGGNEPECDEENDDSPRVRRQRSNDSATLLAVEGPRKKLSQNAIHPSSSLARLQRDVDRPVSKSDSFHQKNSEEEETSNDAKPLLISDMGKQNSKTKIKKLNQTKNTMFSSSELARSSKKTLLINDGDVQSSTTPGRKKDSKISKPAKR